MSGALRGRLCARHQQPAVTIKNVECAIADRAWEEGFAPPAPPERHLRRTVAVIGSGPAGLARPSS
ncbi:hypothetical protein GCM10023238_15870 [Streptomyces heliomycini]